MAVVLTAFAFTFTAFMIYPVLGYFPQLDFQCLVELRVPLIWEKDQIILETIFRKSISRRN